MRQKVERGDLFPVFSLRSAIVREQLLLEYQPIVELATGRVAAVEALIRWRHPAFGIIAPSHFMSTIQEPAEHRQLDLWVLQTACREMRSLEAACGRALTLSINVSPDHIGDPASITEFAAAIRSGIFDPSRLVLEVTESAALRDTERAIEAIGRLKALGVRFAIDDFGTGFATLDYLARLPADFLKIDRSFIGRFDDEKHAIVIDAVLAMAERLKLGVIMEGIERLDQHAFALTCKAKYGQGFLLSHPIAANALADMVASGALLRP